jgi:enolase-phosphatase E1
VTVDLPRAPAAVVLDIEGTTTPIDFVHRVLFGYARAHLGDFLARDAAAAPIAALAAEHAADRDPARPPGFEPAAYVHWLMDRDRKSTALKTLQGLIWRAGYESGELRSVIYPDVPPALARWRAAGITIAIYSSGSVEAQRLLFRYTDHGDLTPEIDRYFDTTTGPKRDAASYGRIAVALGVPAPAVAFVSDVGAELVACAAAGMRGVLSIRSGNAPVDGSITGTFPSVTSFAELH